MNCLSDSPSLSDCMHASTPRLSACLSSTMTDHPSTTTQSLPFMNGEQSHQANKSIHVDPPKSGEDTHETCAIMGDLGLSTLSLPRFVSCASIDPSVHHMKHPSDSPSSSDHVHTSMPCLSACLSSTMTDHLSATSQSLPFMNGEQSHQAKKFYWAFPTYELLFSASSYVDRPKSGEDPCETCEIMGDSGLSTLSLPRFGSSYISQ